jgi:hypothetical protein
MILRHDSNKRCFEIPENPSSLLLPFYRKKGGRRHKKYEFPLKII